MDSLGIMQIAKAINIHEGQYRMNKEAGFEKYAEAEYYIVKGLVEALTAMGYEVIHIGNKAHVVKKEVA